mgnify:CR=1 FL=1|tara:strand:- start:120 stop:455 length:336 start_codon:yes stop_codon:yes gene_type:complete
MHGGGPALLILAKREIAGDELPDFSGDSFGKAKKEMVNGESDSAVRQSSQPEGLAERLSAIADCVEEGAEHGKQHAADLRRLIDEVGGRYRSESGPDGKEERSIGERKELK